MLRSQYALCFLRSTGVSPPQSRTRPIKIGARRVRSLSRLAASCTARRGGSGGLWRPAAIHALV